MTATQAALDDAHAKILGLEARCRALEAQLGSLQGALQAAYDDAQRSRSAMVAYSKDAERSKHDLALAHLDAKVVGRALPRIREALAREFCTEDLIGRYVIAAIQTATDGLQIQQSESSHTGDSP